jgi:hypothetical protein
MPTGSANLGSMRAMILTVACAVALGAVGCSTSSGGAAGTVERDMNRAGEATQRGLGRAGDATGRALGTAVERTGEGVGTAIDETGQGLEKAGKALRGE